jgi:polysaccharide export outer membrane protein
MSRPERRIESDSAKEGPVRIKFEKHGKKRFMVSACLGVFLIGPGADLSVALQTSRANVEKQAALPVGDSRAAEASHEYFRTIYRDFYDKYELGPGDEVAIRILGQPDYSIERTKVSPVGRLYHPLLGDIEVAGMTVRMLIEKLTSDLSQFLISPKVSVSLLEATSAKAGVLGEVVHPGIIVLSHPTTLLDAIAESGGVTDFGDKTSITLLRRLGDGRMSSMTVNFKRIAQGKAKAEENIMLQAGDTLIVHGNLRKTLAEITSMLGFGNFLTFVLMRPGTSK